MTTSRFTRTAVLLAAGCCAAALALSGCSSSGSTQSSGSSDDSSSSSNSTLDKAISDAEQLPSSYPVPTEPVSGVDALKGKTVYYIPITMQAPQFSVTAKAITAAFKRVGITTQVCDGKGTPTDVGNCVTQAIGAGAAGIVADAVPYALAANALDKAQASGIPVVVGNQGADADHPASATLSYVPAGSVEMSTALLEWVAKDSGGKADILINEDQDGPFPAIWMKSATAKLKKVCPDCTFTINKISSANFAQVAPSTSAALTGDPNINYVVVDFAQFLQPTQGGIQSAGAANSVKLVSGAAQLGTLQALKSGQLAAASGQSAVFNGWTEADNLLRLATKTALPKYPDTPTRLFTPGNLDSVKLTAAAEASGEWYGPASFTDDYAKLWGAK